MACLWAAVMMSFHGGRPTSWTTKTCMVCLGIHFTSFSPFLSPVSFPSFFLTLRLSLSFIVNPHIFFYIIHNYFIYLQLLSMFLHRKFPQGSGHSKNMNISYSGIPSHQTQSLSYLLLLFLQYSSTTLVHITGGLQLTLLPYLFSSKSTTPSIQRHNNQLNNYLFQCVMQELMQS